MPRDWGMWHDFQHHNGRRADNSPQFLPDFFLPLRPDTGRHTRLAPQRGLLRHDTIWRRQGMGRSVQNYPERQHVRPALQLLLADQLHRWADSRGLIRASDGNLYGVTFAGGANGVIFRMSPRGTLTTLHNFCSQANCADGVEPNGIIQATNGNFYGVTFAGGGSTSRGTIFKMTMTGTFTTLYTICAQGGSVCPDGAYPAVLFQAADGNLLWDNEFRRDQ